MPLLILAMTGLFLVCIIAAPAPADERQTLPARWQRWLDSEVMYIISDREREIFLQLETERQREQFEESFWESRDPTPGTEVNEFREEHQRRLAYADKMFSIGAVRAGRYTDRGRIYILLGEPISRTFFPNRPNIYPVELWFYQGDLQKRLPSHFYLIFFQRFGAGEFVLYNPISDGPDALVVQVPSAYSAYDTLQKVDDELAAAAFNYLPAGTGIRQDRPNLSSLMVLAAIDQMKNIGIDAVYAEQILTGRERVVTDYTFRAFEIDHTVVPVLDEAGNGFIDFAMLIPFSELKLGQYGDSVYGSLEIVSKLADTEGLTIYSTSRNLEFNIPRDQLETTSMNPIYFEERIPCIPGRYMVTVNVRNKVSKEQYFLSKTVEVPPSSSLTAGAGALLVSQDFQELPQTRSGAVRPGQYAGIKLFYRPDGIVTAAKPLLLYCQSYYPQERILESREDTFTISFSLVSSAGEEIVHKENSIPKSAFSPNGLFHLFIRWPMENLESGDYSAIVALDYGEGFATELRNTEFEVVRNPVPIPQRFGGEELLPGSSGVMYNLGTMWELSGDPENAEREYLRALQIDPDSKEIRNALADLCLKTGKFEKIPGVLEPLVVRQPDNAELLRKLGFAYFKLGENSKALKMLNRLLGTAEADTELLNLIGKVYFNDGRLEEAEAAWRKSLAIDPGQEEIIRLLKEVTSGKPSRETPHGEMP